MILGGLRQKSTFNIFVIHLNPSTEFVYLEATFTVVREKQLNFKKIDLL